MMTVADLQEVLDSYRRLVRELDVLLNGAEGAAKNPRLCDIVAQIAKERDAPGLTAYLRQYRHNNGAGLTVGYDRPGIDREFAHLRAQLERATTGEAARWTALGQAIERAAGELPEGYELSIEVERGSGTVALYDLDGDRLEEFLGDTMAEQAHNAIDYARSGMDEGVED